MLSKKFLFTATMACILSTACYAQTVIGEVSTNFKLLGANDKVQVDRYDDPRVKNVSCYVSRAVTGGISGSLGLASDPSRFSIACRAVGPVQILGNIPKTENVFDEKVSFLFKYFNITRLLDQDKAVLVYLITSTTALSGSPFNSISAVPLETNVK